MKKLKIALSIFVSVAVALTGLLFYGCKKKDYNHIVFNEVTHSIFYAPFYAAINLGYLEDEGLSISLTNGGGSNISMTALLSGSADMILAGPETVVYTNMEGITDQPKVFGQLTQTDGSFIVSKKGSEFTINDLVNETIIGGRDGGLPAMTLEYVIKKAGLQIGTGEGQVNLRKDVEFNAIASAFENSDANFCTLFEPNATNLVKAHPEYHIVGSVAGLVEDLVQENIPYTCFIAKDSYLKKHGDVAEKFLRAVNRAYTFLKDCYQNNHLRDAANALIKSFDGMTLEDLEVAVKAYYEIDAFSKDMVMSRESFETLIKITESAGKTDGNTNYDDVVTTDIAKRLAQ